jgi:hypothetical protein
MEDGKLADTQQCLGEIIRRAETGGPQRVRGPDGDAFILSADDYARYATGFVFPDDAGEATPMSFVEFMRTSPLAQAMAAGEIDPDEWDRACRIGR